MGGEGWKEPRTGSAAELKDKGKEGVSGEMRHTASSMDQKQDVGNKILTSLYLFLPAHTEC